MSSSIGLSASSGNSSLAWVMGNAGRGHMVISFPLSLDSGWYKEQPCTIFRTFEHRKERKLFKHEFILLRLLDGSVCRIERTGDPNARFNALRPHGSIAHDMVQCFRPDELDQACLESSDVIAEVRLPCNFELMDVLKVCRAIHEGEKTRNYTLQVFNCYFFSLAIQVCLVRLVAHWEDYQSLGHWISQTRKGVETLTDTFQSVIASSTPRQSHALYRVYSILALGNDRSPISFIQEVMSNLQSRWTYQTDNIRSDLALKINSVLWYSDIRPGFDQFVEDEVKQAMVDVFRVKSIHSKPGKSVEAMKEQLLLILAKLLESKYTEDKSNLLPPETTTWSIKRRTLHQSNPVNPQTNTTEMSFTGIQSPHTPEKTSVNWFEWIASHALYLGYLVLCAVDATLRPYGITVRTFEADPIECYIIDQKLESIATEFESLDEITTQDLTRLHLETEALTKSKTGVTIWDKKPWATLCHCVKYYVSENVYGEIELNKPELNIRVKGWLEPKPVSVSAFQAHIIDRIRIHAQTVQSVWLGSAEAIEVELNDILSQVWKLIREDWSIGPGVPSSRSPFTRVYTANRSSNYRDQLNVWCDRIGIAHLRFNTDLVAQRDEHGHLLYQALPIFPNILDLGGNYAAQGWTEQEAYRASLSQIPWDRIFLRPDSIYYDFDHHRDGSIIAKPRLIKYGDYVQLTNVVGFGTSRRSAEEKASEILLLSGRYCFY
ncbi:hypothetical protein RSOL_180690 [Rhizoctonia solani AG-3 Rhs1AP]|uniref:Uncharacterized protein n=1 Tax=Rhizoctonia solani AG-3 Rhs1AP TaxID=1086054 RepID=X8J3J6_9AGAM|nr:hypothetical protein RSOL_180690 [Rhizoctonia solani AG-3 Rhs1AP]